MYYRMPVAEEERRVILEMNSADLENNLANAESIVGLVVLSDMRRVFVRWHFQISCVVCSLSTRLGLYERMT